MFEKLFDIDKNVSNIICSNSELKVVYIYDFFVQTKKSLLVVTNSLFEAGKIYHALENYTSDVLFFPMDDFLTSEALAISPELQITRLETINEILKNDHKIVVTNLMGFLRYLPKKEIYLDKIIKLKKDSIISKEELLTKLSEMGYKREITVSKTGDMAVRGYVIDIFPIDYLSPIRFEFWDDQIDMIKIFDEFNIKYNLMVNDYYEGSQTNLIYKGNNVNYFESVICVYYDEDNLKECERKGFNTLKIVNYIDTDLFSNIKKFLNKGNIIFIKESYNNLNELRITLNYIKSRGYNVISVNELLS